MKLEEEAKKFMQDNLVIAEVMTADFYEARAGQTAIFPKEKALEYLALGLTSEVGDVLWYCAVLASELGVSLNVIMQKNLEKLHGRKERGTLAGSGDDR